MSENGLDGGSSTQVNQQRVLTNTFKSMNVPLRSTLLDPTINTIPKSKTRTEYLEKVKKLSMPSQDVNKLKSQTERSQLIQSSTKSVMSSSGIFDNSSSSVIDSSNSTMTNYSRSKKYAHRIQKLEPIKECLNFVDTTLIKHNFYVNKYDQTAWNDFDAIPRSCSTYGLTDHGGSRKRLMFSRQQMDREHAAVIMENARLKQPSVDTRRLKLISDMSVENS